MTKANHRNKKVFAFSFGQTWLHVQFHICKRVSNLSVDFQWEIFHQYRSGCNWMRLTQNVLYLLVFLFWGRTYDLVCSTLFWCHRFRPPSIWIIINWPSLNSRPYIQSMLSPHHITNEFQCYETSFILLTWTLGWNWRHRGWGPRSVLRLKKMCWLDFGRDWPTEVKMWLLILLLLCHSPVIVVSLLPPPPPPAEPFQRSAQVELRCEVAGVLALCYQRRNLCSPPNVVSFNYIVTNCWHFTSCWA